MTMRTSARLFSVALLSLGLITGCASTEETTDTGAAAAEQAIADAKSANAEAKAANYEWRDTGKMIEDAKALINSEKQAAIAEMREQVASLSVEIAEKLMRRNLSDDKSQRALVDQFINEANKN